MQQMGKQGGTDEMKLGGIFSEYSGAKLLEDIRAKRNEIKGLHEDAVPKRHSTQPISKDFAKPSDKIELDHATVSMKLKERANQKDKSATLKLKVEKKTNTK